MSPISPISPTTVIAAAVNAPLIAVANDKVAITRITMRASATSTNGLERTFLMVLISS